jgi:nucleoid DNA-binding protein
MPSGGGTQRRAIGKGYLTNGEALEAMIEEITAQLAADKQGEITDFGNSQRSPGRLGRVALHRRRVNPDRRETAAKFSPGSGAERLTARERRLLQLPSTGFIANVPRFILLDDDESGAD